MFGADLTSTVSAKHQFIFNGVSVSLPGPDEERSPFDLQRLRLTSWRSEGKAPLEYDVRSLTMEMELPESTRVPEEVRRLPPKQFELFQPAERDQLDRTVNEAGEELRTAHSYRLKFLRWKSGIGYIGDLRPH
jgi:hypothetical protein